MLRVVVRPRLMIGRLWSKSHGFFLCRGSLTLCHGVRQIAQRPFALAKACLHGLLTRPPALSKRL